VLLLLLLALESMALDVGSTLPGPGRGIPHCRACRELTRELTRDSSQALDILSILSDTGSSFTAFV